MWSGAEVGESATTEATTAAVKTLVDSLVMKREGMECWAAAPLGGVGPCRGWNQPITIGFRYC